MDSGRYDRPLRLRVSIAIVCSFVAASFFSPLCDARIDGRTFQNPKLVHRISSKQPWKKLKSVDRFLDTNELPLMDFPSYDNSYGSPSSLPLPPFTSLAPQPTPSSSSYPSLKPPNLPDYSPIANPPYYYYAHSPSGTTLSPSPNPPPKHGPSPPKSGPSPPQVYPPPLVYPPPPPAATASSPPPPAPHKKPQSGKWCVAKPTVPDPIIQAAMDYACGSGADCKSIQPNGPCYQPNTMLAHASFAFNSYWQKTKAGGGTCDFGGTAMLVSVDPSFDKCRFMMT